jgi:TonB family protein
MPVLVHALLIPLTVLGCSERARTARQGGGGWFNARAEMPDERPQMLNEEVPFRYPVSLYLQRVQGNVTLRLFVDAEGRVVSDSTRILEASGHMALDSAALAGAARLQFRPARRGGTPIPVSLLYPVHFRHPEGRLPAGDSL